MAPHPMPLFSVSDMDALLAARHGDPFSVLGPHPWADKDGTNQHGLWVIRCCHPSAEQVWVCGAGQVIALDQCHPDGLFAALVPQDVAQSYVLRRQWADGSQDECYDPYCFPPVLGELDMHLLIEGRHLRTFEKLGAHRATVNGISGVHFAVWAPNAQRVSVVGTFNQWDGRRHPMRRHHDAGVWEIFIPALAQGEVYKFELVGAQGHVLPLKADPYGHYAEVPPRNASIIWDLAPRDWADGDWMGRQQARNDRHAPVSIYEVHLASWRRVPEEDNRSLTYLELADQLADYVSDLGFTHVELLPVHEHPFSGSWGYQPVGLYAPTSRFGTPEEFRAFIERLHQRNIGVIMDWVAGHFPSDPHGLHYFDGTHLYEHEDPRQGFHKDWNTMIFNYGRREVVNYLVANALYWMEHYHIDGLRVDAVASMLYLDYSRQPGEWVPNNYGGNENLEAIDFLRQMNEQLYAEHPGAMTIAEESTAWPMVSRPVYVGGLGFGFKWNMGWMHDTLRYMSKEPVHRRYHHDDLTFGLLYAFQENFVLPLSHDEVVHGKGSIFTRMPGDEWQKFANLRCYYAFMWSHPGKKLLFMGSEFGQVREWNCEASLDWHLLADGRHDGLRRLIKDLNHVYRTEPAMHQWDCDPRGFAWIDCNDRDNSVLSFLRRGESDQEFCIIICNFTPIVRHEYRIGVPLPGYYREILNSDSHWYGGSNIHNHGGVGSEQHAWHGHNQSIRLSLPPLSTLILKREP